MKAIAVHTCPLVEEEDGWRRPYMEPEPDPPEHVGWCNVLIVEIAGERRLLLINLEIEDL